MREIALDTETTGFDPFSGHRVVEIGCVEMINRIKTGNVFHAYLNPQRDMPEEAFRVHGISGEFLKDKPLFADVALSFLEFIDDAPLVIHNAGFDMKFINWELGAAGHTALPMERALDTVLIARRLFPGSPASLDALCRRFAIDLSERTKHGALLDAELLADVYLELTGGRQSALSLVQENTTAALSVTEDALKVVLAARSFPPAEDELAAHNALLDKLKNPLWRQQENT